MKRSSSSLIALWIMRQTSNLQDRSKQPRLGSRPALNPFLSCQNCKTIVLARRQYPMDIKVGHGHTYMWFENGNDDVSRELHWHVCCGACLRAPAPPVVSWLLHKPDLPNLTLCDFSPHLHFLICISLTFLHCVLSNLQLSAGFCPSQTCPSWPLLTKATPVVLIFNLCCWSCLLHKPDQVKDP